MDLPVKLMSRWMPDRLVDCMWTLGALMKTENDRLADVPEEKFPSSWILMTSFILLMHLSEQGEYTYSVWLII